MSTAHIRAKITGCMAYVYSIVKGLRTFTSVLEKNREMPTIIFNNVKTKINFSTNHEREKNKSYRC